MRGRSLGAVRECQPLRCRHGDTQDERALPEDRMRHAPQHVAGLRRDNLPEHATKDVSHLTQSLTSNHVVIRLYRGVEEPVDGTPHPDVLMADPLSSRRMDA